jgi:plastocyanin
MKVFIGFMVALLVVVVISIGVAIRDRTADTSTGSAEIVLEDLRFSPSRLDAKVGVPLTVRLTNRGLERHDLNFPALHMAGLQGVESILEPGETRTITLRFEAPGSHTFICSLPGHAAAGMTGAVFVRP